ncbi:MAG: hypothetical protein ABI134_21725 [Byssovorax sp.]
MAEKNDRDDEEQDEKDETVEEESAKEKAALTDEKVTEDEDEDDEEEEAKPAAKPVARAAAVKPAVKPAVAKRGAAPLAKGRPVPVRKGGSLGKSMLLFVLIVGGLTAAFVVFGESSSSGPAAPKWKVGESPELELTLVADDKTKLACAAPEEIAGARCAFEDKTKARPAGDTADDKKLLRPYTTVDHVQVLASGLWSDPALTGTLPTTRFSVKCKYKVEGKVKSSWMRWDIGGNWNEVKDIYAGSISGCKLVQ